MPSDNVHNLTGILLLGASVYLLLGLGLPRDFFLVFTTSYLFSLLWLSPDLDVDRGSGSLRRWGPLRYLWYPYKELFRHRGISHSIILGPLTRVLYMGTVLWTMTWVLSIGLTVPRLDQGFLYPFLLGMWLPDALHCLLDRMVTGLKS
jgi:uncharacterized metal-binding protein